MRDAIKRGALQTGNRSLVVQYVKCGQPRLALVFYEKQQSDVLQFGRNGFISLLKACTILKDVDKGRRLHSEISRCTFLERDSFVGTALLDFYAKCGLLASAVEVFERIPCRDVVLWTALVANYVEFGFDSAALDCVECMKNEGISPNEFTLTCSLKACDSLESLEVIHAEIVEKGWETELHVGSTLVDMYAAHSAFETARNVLDMLPYRTCFAWTSMIKHYAEQGHDSSALTCFEDMQADGVVPDAITYVCILKAYATAEKLTKGRILYSELVKRGFERELLIRSTLLDVYVKQGALEEAQEVFTRCRPHDVVMWNALIAGLTDRGKPDEALLYFKQMHQEGCVPDMVTFAATLKASSILQVRSSSQALHALLTKQGMEALVGSALVDAYCKLNLFMEAQSVFKGLYEHDIFASTTLVACYVEQGHGGDALDSFVQMDLDKVVLDSVSCVCSLKACGHSGALNKGMGLHCDIIKRGLEAESGVSNILIDMYSKCGVFDTSIKLFDKLRVKDLVTWNMHLALYSHSGDSDKATIVFVAISAEGLTPDEVSFGCVLKAYSHAGLMNDGLFFLVAMLRDYQFVPTLEHYTSIVDLVGRTGCIGMALRMVNAMPMHPDTTAWHSLLAACQKQGDAEAGRYTFEQIMELDREAIASYVCMYNICSDSKGIDTHDGKPQ